MSTQIINKEYLLCENYDKYSEKCSKGLPMDSSLDCSEYQYDVLKDTTFLQEVDSGWY